MVATDKNKILFIIFRLHRSGDAKIQDKLTFSARDMIYFLAR